MKKMRPHPLTVCAGRRAAIVEFPTVMHDLLAQYSNLFVNEPERQQVAEELPGLFIAERTTVRDSNREFAVTTDQSCLNRSLTGVNWDAHEATPALVGQASACRIAQYRTAPCQRIRHLWHGQDLPPPQNAIRDRRMQLRCLEFSGKMVVLAP